MTNAITTGSPDAWLDDRMRGLLETELLPAFLRGQRWYAGKARELTSVRLVDASPAGALCKRTVLALAEVAYDDDTTDTYLLPLTVHPAEEPMGPAQDRQLGRLEWPGGEIGFLVDALADVPSCEALLGLIEGGRAMATASGSVRGERTSAYADARGPADRPLPAKPKTVEQSNSVVVFGDRLFMKVFRRVEPGLNPDLEIGRFLVERTSFRQIPKTAGAILYERDGGEPYTLAILQEMVAATGTGWEFALGRLADSYRKLDARPNSGPPPEVPDQVGLDLADLEPPPDVAAAIGPALDDAALLGRRTAELHRALASVADDPAFAPEPIGPPDLEAVARSARSQVEKSLGVLRTRLANLKEPARGQAARVLEAGPRLLDRLSSLASARVDAAKIRVHGDYHLGQVLRVGDDYVLLDFEGEPARSLDERRARQSPLKDVVGMLRSFDYAAYAGLFAHAGDDPAVFDRLAPWARAWRTWTAAAFLRAYRDEAEGAAFWPADRRAFAALLDAFTLEKALYELLYELANRPDWVPIPLQGVLGLIESEPGG